MPRKTLLNAQTRRRFLGTTAAVAGMTVTGCLHGEEPVFDPSEAPDAPGVRSWEELEDLDGELTVYSGRTRDQIDPIFAALEREYPDLTIDRSYDDNAAQLNSLIEEGDATPADMFYTQSSGALAQMKQEGLARPVSDGVFEEVETEYVDPDGEWVGASGRVRAVQYNTNDWDGDELPNDIFAYAEDDRFEGVISTRPNSGTFRSFIIAMIELEGEEATRDWVRSMVEDQDATLYSSGSQQAEEVAAGNQSIALGNQYYAGRIVSETPDAPIGVAFTENDAGCLFNVSGMAVPAGADNPELAEGVARHILASEGQWFFVAINGEYPVVDGVEYVGDLPALDDINPPEFDLNRLADVERATDLLNDEGMVV